MESLEPKIELSEDVMQKAKMPLQKMMDMGRGD
jgi:quinolinate synthase